mmetsp:Transcript_58385/g.170735  ORF Transcript_58385/g.170735 Transcript_58385/m.170735 type:complete len:240 (-) Transcript_58385:714-1433(-)
MLLASVLRLQSPRREARSAMPQAAATPVRCWAARVQPPQLGSSPRLYQQLMGGLGSKGRKTSSWRLVLESAVRARSEPKPACVPNALTMRSPARIWLSWNVSLYEEAFVPGLTSVTSSHSRSTTLLNSMPWTFRTCFGAMPMARSMGRLINIVILVSLPSSDRSCAESPSSPFTFMMKSCGLTRMPSGACWLYFDTVPPFSTSRTQSVFPSVWSTRTPSFPGDIALSNVSVNSVGSSLG